MHPKPIHVFAIWKVKPGNLDAVLGLLPQLVEATAAEPGNLFYQVHQQNTDPNTLVLFEGYEDDDALNAHRKSPHFETLVAGKIIPLLENRNVILSSPLDL